LHFNGNLSCCLNRRSKAETASSTTYISDQYKGHATKNGLNFAEKEHWKIEPNGVQELFEKNSVLDASICLVLNLPECYTAIQQTPAGLFIAIKKPVFCWSKNVCEKGCCWPQWFRGWPILPIFLS
jgi:hypothetical protein